MTVSFFYTYYYFLCTHSKGNLCCNQGGSPSRFCAAQVTPVGRFCLPFSVYNKFDFH